MSAPVESGSHWPNGTVTAASAARDDVNAAISAAVDGQIVEIPNGTATWTSGIATSKQIWVRAQNYTETPMGTMTRNVTITNNSGSAPLFHFTVGSTYHCALSGIRFNEGSAVTNYIRFSGTGTKKGLLSDCAFQIQHRTGDNPTPCAIVFLDDGGVMWNCYCQGIGTAPEGGVGTTGGSILVEADRIWDTASTFGTNDTDGIVNTYFEDNTFFNIGACPDVDHAGRFACRHNIFDGAWGTMHGLTSTLPAYGGGRHSEWYDNEFKVTSDERNMANRYLWFRGGSAVVTDNSFANTFDSSDYGQVNSMNLGEQDPGSSYGSYPVAKQVGQGHNGSGAIREAVYYWGNTGARADTITYTTGWSTYVVTGDDLILSAKPDYTKYTYPHPLRAGVEA